MSRVYFLGGHQRPSAGYGYFYLFGNIYVIDIHKRVWKPLENTNTVHNSTDTRFAMIGRIQAGRGARRRLINDLGTMIGWHAWTAPLVQTPESSLRHSSPAADRRK